MIMNVIVKILGSKLHQNSRCELLASQVTFQLEMQELAVEMDSRTGSFSPCDTEHWGRGIRVNFLLVGSQEVWEWGREHTSPVLSCCLASGRECTELRPAVSNIVK